MNNLRHDVYEMKFYTVKIKNVAQYDLDLASGKIVIEDDYT